jgi:glucosaminylphosphatidylinositol acyltransferase
MCQWPRAAAGKDHCSVCRCVTLFRASLTAYTCIAILAVDFPFFPRRLAKAETFGTGLMDIGPGTFVFSSGLCLGLRLLRMQAANQRSKSQPSHTQSTEVSNRRKQVSDGSSTVALLIRATRSVGPLLLLGLARMLLTKAVDYQVWVLSSRALRVQDAYILPKGKHSAPVV